MKQLNSVKWFFIFSILMLFPEPLLAQTGADFISTPSEKGAPAFRPHLVRPGEITTYIIRVKNIWDKPVDIALAIDENKTKPWSSRLSDTSLPGLESGACRDVTLTVSSSPDMKAGEASEIKVSALADNKYQDSLTVATEIALHRKVYFISIDSLHPDYMKLNAAGTGTGKDGDWLMPNLHRLADRAVFYPKNKAHIISATDMNHFNYLAGTMTGTSGIPLVGAVFAGFDEKGNPIIISNYDLKSPITTYDSGKFVPTIYNSAKAANPKIWNAFASGKNWVPQMMNFKPYQLDRIINGISVPDFVPATGETTNPKAFSMLKSVLTPGPSMKHNLGNPAELKEPQDKREYYILAKLMSASPSQFPPDRWVMDAALAELKNEDPDVFYILLAAVDDAGHTYGSAFDPSEWDDRGTPNVIDDVSKFDSRASRQGILNVVRDADTQAGRFLNALEERGALDDAIVVIESDHAMVTHIRKPLDMRRQLKDHCKRSPKTEFFFGTATSVGFVVARQDDPKIIQDVEAALESWRVKNPVTGKEECPVIVYNRAEMKTGFDQATGKQWMLPKEYYSEYYVEHRKPGEVCWVDLLVLTAPNYKYKLQNLGLGNLGMANLPFKLPEWGYFIGGHGSYDTQAATLILSVPGNKPAIIEDQVYVKDVAPTIEKVQGWQIPDSTDGKPLPGIK